jgi:hypothetical protein
VTSYTEMNMVLAQGTGHRSFYFDQESERAAMGYLRGRISDREFHPTGMLVSAIVNYLDANDADPGFYKLAQTKGLLPPGQSRARQWEFWATHVAEVSLHTDGKPSTPRGWHGALPLNLGQPRTGGTAAQIRLHATAPHSDRDRRPGVTWSMSRPRRGEDPRRDARVVHTSRGQAERITAHIACGPHRSPRHG